MIQVFVEGVGVTGPGLDGWVVSRPVLAGLRPYEPAAVVPRPITLLPPAERRRTGTSVKLAIGVGIDALADTGRDPATMAMVFTSSSGDGETIQQILCVLATDAREVSPTRFHNSVHNAAAGYWSVATGSREPSTSLCAFDASFSAGLLDAAVQAVVDRRPVTLVAYDVPYPEPLHGVRPIGSQFATAFVLTPDPTNRAVAKLSIDSGRFGLSETHMADAALERLRLGNPAARALPLLAALARDKNETVCLVAATGTSMEILVEPK